MLSPDATSSTKHLFGHVTIALQHGNASLWLRPCPLNWMVFNCFTAVVFLLFYFIFLLIFVHLFFACPLFVCLLVSYHQNSIKKNNKKTTAYLICKIILFSFWFLFTCFFVCPSFGHNHDHQNSIKNKKLKKTQHI